MTATEEQIARVKLLAGCYALSENGAALAAVLAELAALRKAGQAVITHAWPSEGGEFADDDNATLALTELKAALAACGK